MTSEPVRVRRFRPADLGAVMAIERASFRRDAYPRDLFHDYYMRGAMFLVAESGRVICGYALAARTAGRRAELVSIAVRPSARRLGAGKALLASVLRRLRRAGVDRISLMAKVSNHAAIRFYESFGFGRLRCVRAYYEDGADGLLMVRDV
jgi:[ribosomal protein S18]-alanine N-acetyltransferase